MRKKIILGAIIFLLTVGLIYGCHDCTNHIEWLDAICIEEDGSVRSSGICKLCNKVCSFRNGELIED